MLVKTLVECALLALLLCCKDSGPAGPRRTGAAPALPGALSTRPPPVSPPAEEYRVGGEPVATTSQVAEVRRLARSLPAATTGGAQTPEAAARAFVAAVSAGDEVATKNLFVSTGDLAAMLPPGQVEATREAIAVGLLKVRGNMKQRIEAGAFTVGEIKTVQGAAGPVTMAVKSTLAAVVGGKEMQLRFKTIIKVGAVWKIGEIGHEPPVFGPP